MLEMDSSWTDIFLRWNSRMYKFMVVNAWSNFLSEAESYGHLHLLCLADNNVTEYESQILFISHCSIKSNL
jgi:hypothetical protein